MAEARDKMHLDEIAHKKSTHYGLVEADDEHLVVVVLGKAGQGVHEGKQGRACGPRSRRQPCTPVIA